MEAHEQLAARRFILVDEEGNPAAYISGAETGFVGLSVEMPHSQEAVISVGVEAATGLPLIHMHGPDGGRVLVTMREGGKPAIVLVDRDGTERVIST